MIYNDRTDVSEGIDVNKSRTSKESIFFHYWFFLIKRLRFQLIVCNGNHETIMMSSDINSILIIYGVDYHCLIVGITKSGAINLLKMRI